MFKSSHRRCSVRKGFRRKFAKFTEKYLCMCLFFNKVAGLTEHLRPSKHSPWWRSLTSSSSQDVFKTSWSRRTYSPYLYVFRRRLQDVLIKTNIFVLVIRLQDVFKTFSRRPQDIFKTSSRCFENVFKTSSRHLQDVFKTYYQVKLFLVTQFQDVFEMYSKRSWDVLLGRLSAGGFTRSNFTLYGQCTNFPRVVKVS